MITAVTNTPPAPPVAAAPSTSGQSTATAPAPIRDTVDISSAATAANAAMKEAMESPAITAQEANQGDRQAQRLLAREAAEK